ncbi:LysR family transcriptional regulator [Stappia sp. MMSF_3263]|uniref:LysR family transcriptional regulator n=1 Tax=Stappia sp. MMSF_3263 TaxID=3046693 RepID=UPI00273F91DA|nr:LysR family transcriptional regulator [Stappia sp. MMSF_3263]
MDQLTALRVFRQVVEGGAFAAAARKLRLSPAAVSKNVGELEAHLGVRLLNRTTRRMSLTEAGTRYYQQVSRILDDLEDADGSMQPLSHSPSGLLRVSAPMSLSLVRFSGAVVRFMQAYPDISLDLQLDDRRVDIVKDGFDLAIRGSDRLEDSSLVARRIMALRHVVCAAPAYFGTNGRPQTPMDLESHDCVQFSLSGHAGEWEFSRDGQTQKVQVTGRYKVTSSLAIRDALRAGFGVSLIPRLYVQDDIAAGRLETALDDWDPVVTQVYAVYPSRRYLLPKVRAFVDFLAEDLRDEM